MNEHLWKSINANQRIIEVNEHALSGNNDICRAIKRGSERSERPSEWARWTSMTFNDALSTSTRFPFLAKTGLCWAQQTYTNLAKIDNNHSGGLLGTQKTFSNLPKTNKHWSGGRLGIIWVVCVKLKKHTPTSVKPSNTGLGVVLGSYGIILGCFCLIFGSSGFILRSSWAHLGVLWARLGTILGSSWPLLGPIWSPNGPQNGAQN